MFLGLSWEKLLVIAVVAAFLVGPERLPRYAEGLAKLVTRGRDYVRGAKSRVQDELGEDFDDVDWRTLDPRRYDPRRIIREALLDDAPVAAPRPVAVKPVSPGGPATAAAAASTVEPFRPGEPAPFDSEAT